MQPQEYVRWSGTDSFGKFSYLAQVSKVGGKDNFVTLNVPGVGTMSVSADDGEFKVIPKPKNFDALKQHTVPTGGSNGDRIFEDAVPSIPKTTAAKTFKPAVERVKKTVDGISKKQQAINIYNSMKVDGIHPDGKEVGKRWEAELGFGKNTIGSYLSSCRRDWCK